MKFCSFDLEIAKVIPDGETDWDRYRPLGISCAATLCTGDERPTLFFDGHYSDPRDTIYGPQMSQEDCQELVRYLINQGKFFSRVPLTWNGLSFDFHTLAEESGMWEECIELAMNHVDMMFQVVCMKGHRLGLDKACKGMGLEGKPEGMSGALAPVIWPDDPKKVLAYVAQDVIQPLRLAEAVERRGHLTWLNNKGTYSNVVIDRWRTVRECLELPLPDTSWMSNPPSREGCYAWITEYQSKKRQFAGLPLFAALL